MKIKLLIIFYSIALFLSFSFKSKCYGQAEGKRPMLYANNFKAEIKEGATINCRKIQDMGVIMYFNEQMKKQDVFKIELHRFGAEPDVMVAFKSFIPDSKEFQKKYADKDSLKLQLLIPEDDFNTSDFEVNTMLFPVDSYTNETVCEYKEKHNSFYLVVKGYNKTGNTNKFGEDIFDKGTEISPRSIIFKNWQDRTK